MILQVLKNQQRIINKTLAHPSPFSTYCLRLRSPSDKWSVIGRGYAYKTKAKADGGCLPRSPSNITPRSDTATKRASESAKNKIAERSCSLRQ